MQNQQTEPKRGFAALWDTRRRTWVRREAKFVDSKMRSAHFLQPQNLPIMHEYSPHTF